MIAKTYLDTGQQGDSTRRIWFNDEFEHFYAGSLPKRAWNRIRGRQNHLLSLSEVKRQVTVKSQHDNGMVTVPVESITGSEGRSEEFNDDFHPLQKRSKERWVSIAAAQQEGKIMPPVELVKVGQAYFVRDGHHRISVAHEVGQKEIDAHVTEWEVACSILFRKPEMTKVC